jgi:chromosome segregation ATPase
MPDRDTRNDEVYLVPGSLGKAVSQKEAHQILQEPQQVRIAALEGRLARARERLTEGDQRRRDLEEALEWYKRAYWEKVEKVEGLERTVETQNCFLRLAWADSQDAASRWWKREGDGRASREPGQGTPKT